MKVYALVFTVGISSGSETLLGLFSSVEKAEVVKMKHSKNGGHALHHYEITELELDKETNITITEWDSYEY